MDMGCGCATLILVGIVGALGIDQCQEKKAEQREAAERYAERIKAVDDSVAAAAERIKMVSDSTKAAAERIKAVNDSAEAYAKELSPQTRSLVERLDSIEANAEYLGRLAERAHVIAEQNPDVGEVFSTHEKNLSSLRDSLVLVGNTIQKEIRVIYLARQMQELQRGVSYSEERDKLLRSADNLLGAAQGARERQTKAMIGNPEDYRHD